MDIVTNHSTTELGHPSNYPPMSSICGGWHKGNFEQAGHLLPSFSFTLYYYSVSSCIISAWVSLSLMKKWKQSRSGAAPCSLHLCFSLDSVPQTACTVWPQTACTVWPQTARTVWRLCLLLFPSSLQRPVFLILCVCPELSVSFVAILSNPQSYTLAQYCYLHLANGENLSQGNLVNFLKK